MAERGEVLAFAGALGGALAGFVLGEKLRHGAAGAAIGCVGGIVGAHLLNKSLSKEKPLAGLSGLGDVPPGYFELGGSIYAGQPVFTRGRLMPLKEFAEYEYNAILNELEPAEPHFRRYPRWTLYGGPTTQAYLDYVDKFLHEWAITQNMRYISDPPAGVVRPADISGGWPHSDFQFHQVYEPKKPRTVFLGTKGGKWGWHYN